jgi:hypothetical protein
LFTGQVDKSDQLERDLLLLQEKEMRTSRPAMIEAPVAMFEFVARCEADLLDPRVPEHADWLTSQNWPGKGASGSRSSLHFLSGK